MGTDNRAKSKLAQQIRTGLFMEGIAMGMEKSHHGNIKPAVFVLGEAMMQLGIDPQGFNHSAAGIQASNNLHNGFGQKRRGLQLKSKQFIAVLVPNAQLIGQTGVGEEKHGSLLVLKQRVGGHGGA